MHRVPVLVALLFAAACSTGTAQRPGAAAALPDAAADAAVVADTATDAAADAALPDLPDSVSTADVAAEVDTALADAAPADVSADSEAPKADAAADAGSDAGAEDVATPTEVVVGEGESGGVLVPGPNGPCVEPDNLVPAACFTVKCSAGKVCMGKGECVPDTAFWADDGAAADQAWPAVATRPDGGYAVAWAAGNFFENKQHVWLRVFALGTEVGGVSVQVSASGTPANLAPSVAAMSDGSWMVLWRRDDLSGGEVSYWMQRVAADGSALVGGPQQVNVTQLGSSESSGSSNIIAPVVVRLRNGRLLMAWSGGAKGGPTPLGIYARLFDEKAQPMSGELETGGILAAGQSFSPAIGALPGGQALLVWQGAVAGGKGPEIVRGRVLKDDGTPQTPVLDLTPAKQLYEALPAVAGYLSGQALLAWKAGNDPTSTSAVTVRGRLLDTPLPVLPGAPLPAGLPAALDEDPDGSYPGAAPVAVLSEHRAMAVWHNAGQPDHTIWGKRHYRSVDAWDCEVSNVGGPLLPQEVSMRHLPALASWENGKAVLVFATLLDGMDQYRVAVRLLQF